MCLLRRENCQGSKNVVQYRGSEYDKAEDLKTVRLCLTLRQGISSLGTHYANAYACVCGKRAGRETKVGEYFLREDGFAAALSWRCSYPLTPLYKRMFMRLWEEDRERAKVKGLRAI